MSAALHGGDAVGISIFSDILHQHEYWEASTHIPQVGGLWDKVPRAASAPLPHRCRSDKGSTVPRGAEQGSEK